MLERLAVGMLAASAHGRVVQAVGPFQAFFSASTEPFLSLALPCETPDAWDAYVPALEAAFAGRGRVPRLEIFAELYPALGPALERAGFTLDNTAPVMVQGVAGFTPVPPDVDYLPLHAEEGVLEPFLYAQSEAYGGLGDALGWLPQLTAGLQAGHILGAALQQDGELVAGAAILRGGDIGELAGVWTKASLRRRGLARRVCGPLLTTFFNGGGTLCWLSAAPGATGLYRRLGFGEVGTQLNYSKGQVDARSREEIVGASFRNTLSKSSL